ncbi:MAG TPA: two-component regulator propeller domain-containing protein [Anaerolineales bacterium]|nr:two-component regulator propeller domain-containing protein [Anaerolineales bacterium]
MKCALFLFFGLVFAMVAASCGTGTNFLNAQPAETIQEQTASTPTSLPPTPSRVAPDSLPPICKCVLRFDRISIENGLSQSSVGVIFQDSRGFLWFGTQDGLNRYDGYNFKIYKPDPDVSSSLSDRWITSIVEDKDGYLWIATRQGGLNRYDPRSETFSHYLHNDADQLSLSDNHINVLYLDKNNNLWVGTINGLDLFERKTNTFKHYVYNPSQQEGISGKNITAIYQDSRGRFWVGTAGGGLNLFNPSANVFSSYQNNPDNSKTISNNYITAIIEDKQSTLWVGTREGLNRFESSSGSFERFMHSETDPQTIIGNVVTDLYMDSTGNLWIATTTGLDRLTTLGRRFTHYRNDPTFSKSLSNNHVISIYEDRGGVLWFGTWGGGVNKYDRQRGNFAFYRNDPTNKNSLSENIILSIHQDTEGYVWIGTSSEGLNRFTRTTNQVIRYQHNPNRANSLSSNEVLSIAEDQDGILWFGTGNGLNRFDRRLSSFLHYKRNSDDPSSLSANRVFEVYVDSKNNLWVGTAGGLDLFDRQSQTFIHYQHQSGNPNSLSGAGVNAILEDREGNLWVGTYDSGLNKFNRETEQFTRYRFDANNQQTISNDSILSIHEDAQGRIWIGTLGGGLNLYHPDTDTFTYYLEKDGLPNGVVYGILEDSQGSLWLSTNFGISRFNPDKETFHNFDAGDGLQSNEFNSGAYAKGRNGELYFGGIEGLTIFYPSSIDNSPYMPQITLTSITQDDNPIATDSNVETTRDIVLRWPQNSLEFEFAALSYNEPHKNQYAYMLEGFDPNWHFIGTKRDGRYTNLPGGEYTLLLKASNSDGIWNDTPVRINITVIPPFWQTLWFRVIVSMFAVAVIAFGFRLRTKTIQDRNRQLERLVRERTSALEKRNQEIQALYEADERILRNVSLNQVFQTLVDVAVDMLHADRSMVLAWNEKQSRIIPRVSHGFSPETIKVMEFAKGEGIVGEVMETGRVVVVRQIDLDEFRQDVREALVAEGVRSFVHLPIVVDHKVIGVFNVGFTRPNLMGDDAMRLFSALTHRASISIANMELFEQTKDLAVMEERNRLARDLHDSAKQKAFAALAQLGTARGILNGHGNSVSMHLSEAENLVTDVIQELTFLVQEIYPIALQEKGLVTTLREHIFEWENRNDISIHLITRNEHHLPLEVEQALYRVTQEALANVARHSHAQRADVALVYNGDSVQLSISDDGCGFDLKAKHGMGLRSIRERVSSIRGMVQIQSAPGQGTRLLVQVPVKGIEGGGNGK